MRLIISSLLWFLVLSAAAAGTPSVELPAQNQPEPGVLTAGQPETEHFRELARAGYTTVVNLRGENETDRDEQALVEELGMQYIALPVTSAEDVSVANARRLDEILAESEGPVLVHCATSNRVGALFALRAHFVQEQDPAEALQYGRNAGLGSLERRVRDLLTQNTAE